MNKELTKEEAEEFYNKLWLENKELEYTIPIVEHNKTTTKHLKEIERLNNIINEIYTKANDTNITSLDLRDYILNNLGVDKK